MTIPDENAPKTGTEPLLEAAQEDEESNTGEPQTSAGEAMREAMNTSDRTEEEIAGTSDDTDSAGGQ
ncbi:hypothetical protein HNP84_001359 [Thermocatellispora tengchongensis]|uniref:Uncharacterized protein n=1 Tax=Thermocatellispora tengchongensis TaxID=1073253 RepID=A0A840NZL1_9ACTN|nr:hypothetical protein [Thermocatellispora tengchongensis]MBB5131646.1 hypothetical protein [Thermocatellispora tengchongensis]